MIKLPLRRMLGALSLAGAALLAAPAYAEPGCTDAQVLGPKMISNVCWSCMMPIRVAGVPLNGSNSGAPSGHHSSPLCMCESSDHGFKTPGFTISMWEPARLIELQRVPGCMSSLNGTRLPFDRHRMGTHGEKGADGRARATQFMHYHYFAFPLFAMLDMFSLAPCSDEYLDFDLMYMSELDPTWNNEALAAYTHPEIAAIANLPAQLACTADAVAATAGNPITSMFWCAGAWGSLYPFAGVAETSDVMSNSSLFAARSLAALHRRGLAKKTMGDDAVCKPKISFTLPKEQYKMNTFHLRPETSSSHAIGESSEKWGAGRLVPKVEDPIYMIWRWKDCCQNL
nr:TraU family protein [uncultured Halomonas sp.]